MRVHGLTDQSIDGVASLGKRPTVDDSGPLPPPLARGKSLLPAGVIRRPAPDPQPRPRGGRSTAPPARRSSGNPGNRHGSRAAPFQRRIVDSPNDNNSPLRDHEHPDR